MGYNNITLHGKQTCDYLFISNSAIDVDSFVDIDSEPTGWTDNTLLLARFNDKSLVAGDSSLTDRITGYKVRRKKGANPYTEYIGTIPENEDKDKPKYMIDYLAGSNSDYVYYLYPSSGESGESGTILSPSVSEEVKTDWGYWSLLVVDETDEENVFYLDKMFKFELNLETDDMHNNAAVSIIQNFTKYPTIQYGTSNYWSSALTSLCGFITCADSEYVQTPNMMEELKSLTTDMRRKFLKDMDGNVWEVKITAPIAISTDDSTLERVRTAKITWTEVGDVSGVSVINNPNKSTTSWLLTETGETRPYINYIWDEQYRWDNSYRWTANEDVLDVDTVNMGRDLFDKDGDE